MAQPQPEYFSKKEWAKAKKQLAGLADAIRKSNKPIAIDHKVQFFSK